MKSDHLVQSGLEFRARLLTTATANRDSKYDLSPRIPPMMKFLEPTEGFSWGVAKSPKGR